MIRFRSTGNFEKTTSFLRRSSRINYEFILQKYGRQGVVALSQNTPKDSGETANSWGYQIKKLRNGYSITWTNDHIVDGIPVVILLQYGHGTRNGSFVQGKDFINPVMRPIFDEISENLWKEVTTL